MQHCLLGCCLLQFVAVVVLSVALWVASRAHRTALETIRAEVQRVCSQFRTEQRRQPSRIEITPTGSHGLAPIPARHHTSALAIPQLHRQQQLPPQPPLRLLPPLPKMLLGPGGVDEQWRKSGDRRPTPPDNVALSAVQWSERAAGGVLVAIMAGKVATLGQTTLCAHTAVSCVVYADQPMVGIPPSIRVVHASEYRSNYSNGRTNVGDCCRPDDGEDYYCDPHRAVTLQHQYRFLPALAHARALPGWRAGALSWLVFIDDDAWVHAERLLRLLGRYDPSRPLYLGDFGHWTTTLGRIPDARRKLLSWEPPYACGGSGSVFSRAAVLQIDFAGCAARYHRGCFQSDWMIGRCAAEAQVMPAVLGASCGTCLSCGAKQQTARQWLVSAMERHQQACAFATLTCEDHIPYEVRQALCRVVRARAAIVHGWNASCEIKDENPFAALLGAIAPNGWNDSKRLPKQQRSASYQVRPPVPTTPTAARPAGERASGARGSGSVITFLQQLRLFDFRRQLVSLGVFQVADLKWLRPDDLRGIGMSDAQSRVLIAAAHTLPDGREHDPFVPKVNSPISSIMHHLRLQKLRDRLISRLKVQTQEDLERVTEAQLASIGFKLLHRRRFLAGIAKLPERDAYAKRRGGGGLSPAGRRGGARGKRALPSRGSKK